MCPNPQEIADLITFTEEILNVKPHFLWCVKVKHRNGANLNLGMGLLLLLHPFAKWNFSR